jgi:hypothetical protein
MIKLEGLRWHQRYNEHMGCMKGCLDYLGVEVSFPWLYGGTGNTFVLDMNDTAFVDCAQAWDTSMLFDLAPNLGFTVERFKVEHQVALKMPDDVFRQKQRAAWDLVRARIDGGLPCYAWELTHIPAYYVITGYDDTGYTYSGWDSGGTCPWQKLGTSMRCRSMPCMTSFVVAVRGLPRTSLLLLWPASRHLEASQSPIRGAKARHTRSCRRGFAS